MQTSGVRLPFPPKAKNSPINTGQRHDFPLLFPRFSIHIISEQRYLQSQMNEQKVGMGF